MEMSFQKPKGSAIYSLFLEGLPLNTLLSGNNSILASFWKSTQHSLDLLSNSNSSQRSWKEMRNTDISRNPSFHSVIMCPCDDWSIRFSLPGTLGKPCLPNWHKSAQTSTAPGSRLEEETGSLSRESCSPRSGERWPLLGPHNANENSAQTSTQIHQNEGKEVL